MLKQLLKYEFKATGRIYGGLYLAILAAAVLAGFSLRSSSNGDFSAVMLLVYIALAVAVAVVLLMTIVNRFTRNLLGREGYLMHTLPVTEDDLILSKLISSVVWALCSMIVWVASFAVFLLVFSMGSWNFPEVWKKIWEIFSQIDGSMWRVLLLGLLNGLLSLTGSILCIYAACMIGHQFKKHPVPVGILAYFLMSGLQNAVTRFISVHASITANVGVVDTMADAIDGVSVSFMDPSAISLSVLLGMLLSAAFIAGYFFLVRWLMKNKLNLE